MNANLIEFPRCDELTDCAAHEAEADVAAAEAPATIPCPPPALDDEFPY